MVGDPSFSEPYLCIQVQSTTTPYNLRQISFLLLHSSFISLFRLYFLTKSLLQSTLIRHSSIPQHFSPPYFCVRPSQQSTPKMFSVTQPFNEFRLRKRTKELCSVLRILNLSLPPQSMDSDNRAHNHWLLIPQA